VKPSILIAAAFIAIPAGSQAIAAYSFTAISDPSGVFGTIANGINNSGAVVGTYIGASGGNSGFVESGNSFTNFDVTGASDTFAQGITAHDSVLGYYIDGSGATHGFTGTTSPFSIFNVTFAGANSGTTTQTGVSQAANERVGYYFDNSSTPSSHGFLNDTPIDYPGAVATIVTGVNNAGTAVGYYVDAHGATHGFVYSLGLGYTTPAGQPSGANGTFFTGINDHDQITGYYSDAMGTHGFVMTGSTFVTIDAPGAADFTDVTGIDDSGEIVGYEVDAATGLDRGFTAVAAAVPEPASLSVVGLAALSLLMTRRRRTL
jgi:hypothetical protein